MSGEAQVQKFGDRNPVAPFGYSDHDPAGIDGIHHLAKRFQTAKDFAAGQCEPNFAIVVQVAGDCDSLLRMEFDVFGDIGEKGAAAHQQEPLAPYHADRESAKKKPPQKKRCEHDAAAQQHHAQRHSERAVHITDQALNEQRRTRRHAQLLQQGDTRFNIKFRIQILEI